MPSYYPPTGGTDPAANVTVTGVWSGPDPTQPQQFATKNYVDTHSISPSSTITLWSNTVSYTVGNFVYSGNAIWCCRVANTNSTPSLTNNNWRREADLDSSTSRMVPQTINSNYTWPKGVFSVRAAGLTADTTVTLSLISSFADSDTTSKIQEFVLIKADNNKTLTLATSSPDTFNDGTTTKTITGNTVVRFFLDFTSNVWRY